MSNAGHNLFKTLHQHMGMSPDVAKGIVPLDSLFNMSFSRVNGDKFYFAGLQQFPVGDGRDNRTECGGRDIQCVGSNQIVLEIDRHWNQAYKFNEQRLDSLNKVSIGDAVNTLMHFKTNQDRLYLLKEAQIGLGIIMSSDDVEHEVISKQDTGNIINVLNKAIADVQTKNPLIPRSEYTMVITQSVANELADLKAGCCDFINNIVSDPTARASFDVGSTVIVPDEWLFSETFAVSYDVLVYVKTFTPYMYRYADNRFEPMTNQHSGYLQYIVDKEWGINFVNFQPEHVARAGVKVQIG